MSYQKSLGEAIARRRRELGWTQRDLASRTGLKQPQIARVEGGKDARLSTLAALAGALGLDLRLEAADAGPKADDHPMAGMPKAWPEADRDSFAIFVYVQRIAELFGAASERLASLHGMTSGELSILGALRRMPEPHIATPTELQRYFWLTLPGVVRRISRVAELGFVEPVERDGDRRLRHYRLTESGQELIDGLVQQSTPEFDAVANLSRDQRYRLSDDLKALVNRLEASAGGVKPDRRRKALARP